MNGYTKDEKIFLGMMGMIVVIITVALISIVTGYIELFIQIINTHAK